MNRWRGMFSDRGGGSCGGRGGDCGSRTSAGLHWLAGASDAPVMRDDVAIVKKLEGVVSVRICETRMSVREVLSMTPGSIIELPTSAEGWLEVLVGGKPVGNGRAVKIGESFGVCIHRIGRLERLDPEDAAFRQSGQFDPEAFADALLASQG